MIALEKVNYLAQVSLVFDLPLYHYLIISPMYLHLLQSDYHCYHIPESGDWLAQRINRLKHHTWLQKSKLHLLLLKK
jgi:hypothetical protein